MVTENDYQNILLSYNFVGGADKKHISNVWFDDRDNVELVGGNY